MFFIRLRAKWQPLAVLNSCGCACYVVRIMWYGDTIGLSCRVDRYHPLTGYYVSRTGVDRHCC
jgi:hypothetical protein